MSSSVRHSKSRREPAQTYAVVESGTIREAGGSGWVAAYERASNRDTKQEEAMMFAE
jgi:hypothetical protein